MEQHRALKPLLLIFAGIGFVLFMLFVTSALLVRGANRRIEAEINRIRACGEPVSLEEMAGSPIPDEWNAAILYQQAFQKVKTAPISNHAKYLENLYSSTNWPLTDRDQLDRAMLAVVQLKTLFGLIDRASKKPDCRFPVDWSKGFGALFPHYPDLRQFARLTSVAALLSAQNGDADSAVRFLRLVVALQESIADEPILIAFLVRRAILAVAISAIRQALDLVDFTYGQSELLFNELNKVDLMRAYKNALIGERVCGLWAFDEARRNPQGVAWFIGGETSSSARGTAGGFLWKWFSSMDESAYLDFMRRQIALAHIPYRDIIMKNIHLPDETDVPRYAFLTQIIAMSVQGIVLARDSVIADLALAQTALAAEAYEDRFGAYPKSIEQLKIKLGWKVPIDPFSGSSLKFKHLRKGYLIYSIGGDLHDDKGKPLAKPGRYDSPGDVVWIKS